MPITTVFSKFADSFSNEDERNAIISFKDFCEAQETPIDFDGIINKSQDEVSDLFVDILKDGSGTYSSFGSFLTDKLIDDVNAVVGTCEPQEDLDAKIASRTNGLNYNELITHLKKSEVINSINDLKNANGELKSLINQSLANIPCSNGYVKSLANALSESALSFDESIHENFELSIKFNSSNASLGKTSLKAVISDSSLDPEKIIGEQSLNGDYVGFAINKRKSINASTNEFDNTTSLLLKVELYDDNGEKVHDTGAQSYSVTALNAPFEIDYTPTDLNAPINFSVFTANELTSNLGISSTTSTKLKSNTSYINSLDDIRKTGSIYNVTDGGIHTITDSDKARLDKLAQLELLKIEIFEPKADDSSSIKKDKALEKLSFLSKVIDLGSSNDKYKSISDIASVPRTEFVTDIRTIQNSGNPILGDLNAIAIHTQAKAITNTNNNLGTSLIVNHSNNIPLQTAVAGSSTSTNSTKYNPGFTSLLSNNCDCSDCETTISPLAYLSALLKYSEDNLRFGNEKADLIKLQSVFKQNFSLLPASCEEMDRLVCQQRIAAEVVRNNYGDISLPSNSYRPIVLRTKLYNKAKEIYYNFLEKLGISYDEVRNLSSLSIADQQKLAERIGISLSDVSILSSISFNIGNLTNDISQIPVFNLYDKLEEIFGIQTFFRDDFSTGVRFDDTTNIIPRHIFRNIVWNKTTDKKGYIYVSVTYNTTASLRKAEFFKDTIRSKKIAEASLASGSTIDLTSSNNSNLKGKIHFNTAFNTSNFNIKISVIPQVLAAKINSQALNWKKQDIDFDNPFIDSPFKSNYFRSIPILDPDIMSYDNIRFFGNVNIVNHVKSIWEKRRIFIDDIIKRFEFTDFSSTSPTTLRPFKGGSSGMFEQMFNITGTPGLTYNNNLTDITYTSIWSSPNTASTLAGLYARLKVGNDSADLNTLKNEIFLTKDAFIRFYELYLQSSLNAQERIEYINILVQAIKAKYYNVWISEELKRAPVTYPSTLQRIAVSATYLSQEFFKYDVHEPIEGNWYPFRSVITIKRNTTDVKIEIPLLDPDTTREIDLRDSNAALTLIADRKIELNTKNASLNTDVKARIRSVYTNTSSRTDFSSTYYSSPTEDVVAILGRIFSDLNSAETTKINNATNELKNIQLSAEDFRFVYGLIIRSNFTTPVFTDNELNSLNTILVRVHKVINLYATWTSSEKTAGLTYWAVNKHALAKWRAPQIIRDMWQEALDSTTTSCIIDTDIITCDDVIDKDCNVLDPALTSINHLENMPCYYVGRRPLETMYIIGSSYSLGVVPANPKTAVRDSIASFDIPFTSILSLYNSGKSIKPILKQSNLTFSEFSYLKKIYDLTENATTASLSTLENFEWESFYNILYNVYKKRASARWRREEQGLAFANLKNFTSTETIPFDSANSSTINLDKIITLSPDQFNLLPSYSSLDAEDPMIWRVNERNTRNWRKTLEERVEARKELSNTHYAMIADVEDEHLKDIRDIFIECAKVPTVLGGTTFIFNQNTAKKVLADRLLVDLNNNCCLKITRISAAIDTIQNLLWQTRTGLLEDTYSNLVLNKDDFDNEWKWLGSYEAWRTYMFVYMYPENLLSPSLKKWHSPAFKNLLQLRNMANVSVREVNEAYADLKNYTRDLSELVVPYNFIASSLFYDKDAEGKEFSFNRFLHYQFGIAPSNGALYYSYFDIYDKSAFAQSFWKKVDLGVKVNRLIGARVFSNSLKERFIYVLFVSAEDNKLYYSRLGIDKKGATWEDKVELKAPGTEYVTDYTWARIETTQNEDRPIKIAFKYAGRLMIKSLDGEGKDWDGKEGAKNGAGEPLNMVRPFTADTDNFNAILYMCEANWGSGSDQTFMIVRQTNGKIAFYIFQNNNVLDALKAGTEFSANGFYGAFSYYNGTGQYVVWVQYKTGNTVKAKTITFNVPTTIKYWTITINAVVAYVIDDSATPILGVSRLSNLLTTYKQPMSNKVEYILVAAGDNKNPGNHLTTLRFNGSNISLVAQRKITPSLTSKTTLNALKSSSDLQRKRNDVKSDITANDGGFRTTMMVLEEAYYFGPLIIAQQLQKAGSYIEALDWYKNIYDYTAIEANRKIYHGLKLEENFSYSFNRMDDWLLDPTNPHNIAATRTHSYTKYTLQSIIRCLLAYADSEFTIDTIETVSRARNLYSTALELLANPLLASTAPTCNFVQKQLVLSSDITEENSSRVTQLKSKIALITDGNRRNTLIETINTIFAVTSNSITVRFNNANAAADLAYATADVMPNLGGIIGGVTGISNTQQRSTTSDGNQQSNIQKVALLVNNDFYMAAFEKTGTQIEVLISPEYSAAWTSLPVVQSPTDGIDLGNYESYERLWFDTNTYSSILGGKRIKMNYIPSLSYGYCVPANPIATGLRLRAELNLFKINNCRNIAGMVRELDAYAAATDATTGMPSIGDGGNLSIPVKRFIRNTDYRYKVVIQRAKELAEMSNRLENALLSMYEKIDVEKYGILKAKQDINVSKQTLKLQDLRYKEAESNVTLGELEKQLSVIQETTYNEWINGGLNSYEEEMLNLYTAISIGQGKANRFNSYATAANTTIQIMASAEETFGATAAVGLASIFASNSAAAENAFVINMQEKLQRVSMYASHERRKDEWTLQRNLATQGLRISDQKIKIANEQVQVVGQERTISQLQLDNAEITLNYLQNKFTNADLYEWMSGVIDTIFRYYINQATAMAKMAADQLYFERQLRDIPIIQDNYYTIPNENSQADDGSTANRRGLTASSLLQQDITKLEQYAFETDRRKLQLTKTISLAKMNPFEFQEFKTTGEINFRTAMESFDKDFPGHYLRLIKRVRVSFIALVPTVDSIKATFTNVGSSRVVIKGDTFSEETIRRGPESVSLTSPINANGLFEMEQNMAEMLYPFEGIGVDTLWNLALPKPANANIDYNTIADVLISIDYTAFEDYDLRNKTVKLLQQDNNSGEIFFSFKNNLPDQWYDLNNPEGSANPMSVNFTTKRTDFPSIVNNISIGKVKMLFSFNETKDDVVNKLKLFDAYTKNLEFKAAGKSAYKGGAATSVDGKILNASTWNFTDVPFGEWRFELTNNDFIKDLIKEEYITDILLVIGFTGDPLKWPSSYSFK